VILKYLFDFERPSSLTEYPLMLFWHNKSLLLLDMEVS
jgi:hypothetical protein